MLQNERISLKIRTITREFKIYKYEELSEKSKKKVKQSYIDNLDSNDFTYMVVEDLKNIGLKNLRPYYNLNYCQGDGLYLVGYINFDEISSELKGNFYKNFILSDYKILKSLKEYSRIDFNYVGRYYHKIQLRAVFILMEILITKNMTIPKI